VVADAHTHSWFERYSWTLFVFFSAILLLVGVVDLIGAATSMARQNAINEIFICWLSAAIAVMGLRRRQRWAWYSMTLWPVWFVAQGLGAASAGKTGEMSSAVFLLVLALMAIALSYRPVFRRRNEARAASVFGGD